VAGGREGSVVTERHGRTTLTSGSRYYTWRQDEEPYWSVTTIIGGGLPKPALINWSANEVASYVCGNLDEISGLIRKDPEGAYDFLKRVPWRKKEKAADEGTAIHEAVEAYVLGKPMPTWPLPLRGKMRAFERFLLEREPEYMDGMSEAPVFNRTERYAGTLDGIFTLGRGGLKGARCLTDVKSGKGVYPDVALQLSAYRFAEFVGAPDGSEHPMPEVDAAVVLHLTETGYDLIRVRADEQTYRSFLYVREVYRWQLEIAKTALQGSVPGEAPNEQEAMVL
jgi:hypothetical protein